MVTFDVSSSVVKFKYELVLTQVKRVIWQPGEKEDGDDDNDGFLGSIGMTAIVHRVRLAHLANDGRVAEDDNRQGDHVAKHDF